MFTSDNGVHHGEHRRLGAGTKSGPYDVGLRVPLVVRGPGFAPGPTITVPSMLTQDIAATILDVAGAKAGLPHQTGISLTELCAHPKRHTQRILLHEIGEGSRTRPATASRPGPRAPADFASCTATRRSGINRRVRSSTRPTTSTPTRTSSRTGRTTRRADRSGTHSKRSSWRYAPRSSGRSCHSSHTQP